jgi:predicted lipoprotein with Yx(FWY)xxD motif
MNVSETREATWSTRVCKCEACEYNSVCAKSLVSRPSRAHLVSRFTNSNIRLAGLDNMVDLRSWTGPLAVVVLILSAGYLVANPFNPNGTSFQGTISGTKYSVNLATNAQIGRYLVNGTGFTLYYFAKDSANGTSECYGGCVTFWPLFYAGDKLALPPGLSASSFGLATRTDGREQSTFEGHPLYYFVKDKAPGQINGQGDNDFYVCCGALNPNSTSNPSA